VSKRPFNIRIRDPIHGTLLLSRDEVALVDHAAYQRLRTIKQLGLADLAYPGATHTRYSHGLGTMHIASRMFTSLSEDWGLDTKEQRRLLQTVRLASLFHDLGHAPLSHTTEAFMPNAGALDLGYWLEGQATRRASHEDYTLKILTGSTLTTLIRERFSQHGVEPEDVATLIAGRAPNKERRERFRVSGVDWMPLMRQIVSSELDADRMDYLLRDSYFAGVPYGRYDHEWLVENIRPVEKNGALYLGFDARASFAFEDYLLSRYHMFMSVYFHHIPISYEVMLGKLHEESSSELAIPADVDGYLAFDDVTLWTKLREAKSEWARRIVERRAYRMLVESREIRAPEGAGGSTGPDTDAIADALRARKVRFEEHTVKAQLSKYFSIGGSRPPMETPPLYIVDETTSFPVEEQIPLYRRYSGAIHLKRIYVEPSQLEVARAIRQELSPT
jgi:HD superfamily phosphohydrolase